MESFDHFLITRFNLKFKEWERTKNGEDVSSELWLSNRFQLFETFCLPSVINQTNQSFKWLVCFDSKTPDTFKTKIKRIKRNYQNFVPLFVEDSNKYMDKVLSEIHKLSKLENNFLITTRLDNDDAIHKDFINTVQGQFKPTSNFIIDIISGYQLILNETNKYVTVRKMIISFNPFLSLVEQKEDINTVLSKQHLDWKKNNHIAIKTEPLWLQIVHNENISNKSLLQFKETNTIMLSNFGISKDFQLKSKGHIIFSNIFSFFKRLLLKLIKN